jgi:hypothetical protein
MVGHVAICKFNPAAKYKCDKGCGLVVLAKDAGSHSCTTELARLLAIERNTVAKLVANERKLKTRRDKEIASLTRRLKKEMAGKTSWPVTGRSRDRRTGGKLMGVIVLDDN